MKKILSAVFFIMLLVRVSAQDIEVPKAPDLEYVMELKVICSAPFSCGMTSRGERVVIPITGGTFEGPQIKGTILNGGADYQYVDKKNNRTELEAIYCIRTDDGVNIHIRNTGLIINGNGEDGKPAFYFRCTPKFEAPDDGKYGWLNNAIFVCKPGFGQGYISLKVWKVK